MARNTGDIGFVSTFELKIQGALDARVVVDNVNDLTLKTTWPHQGNTVYLYEGILVSVKNDNSVYMLKDLSKYNNLSEGWKKIDGGGSGSIDIVDNLESEAANKALSAKQGKILNEKIVSLTSIYSFKGTKESTEELPSEGNKSGDVWYVEGISYVWNGKTWIELNLPIDLSKYYTKTEINDKEDNIKNLISNNTALIQNIDGKVAQNTTLITNISSNINTINTTLTEIQAKNDSYESRIEELEKGGTGVNNEQVEANTQKINNLEAGYSTIKNNVDTLIGNSSTKNSVDYKINQAFKWTIINN